MFCLYLIYERKAKHCPASETCLSLLTLPQASSCDQNQSYNFQSTDRQRMEKSGFFRQHLITSIKKTETKNTEGTSKANRWIVGLDTRLICIFVPSYGIIVFCCIVAWIQPDISGCQQDFLVVWRWNQLRTF